MDSPFMNDGVGAVLGDKGYAVVRFEFPYMATRRREGGRRPPDRAPILLDAWRHIITEFRTCRPSL